MEDANKVIVTDCITGLGTEEYVGYLFHGLCTGGRCLFAFNEKEFEMMRGSYAIIRKTEAVHNVRPSKDFRVRVVYISPDIIELSTPQSNYGMRGQLALYLNPVMQLTDAQAEKCRQDIINIDYRMADTDNHFRHDTIINAVQTLILDSFDFHSRLYGDTAVSSHYAEIMRQFMAMLDRGDYRTNREVSYYASELCITPKYLSEVAKSVSGYGANFWINRYTMLDISRLLRDKNLSFVQISNMFGFSSPAYFSRYVQKNLGLNPTEYRG